MYFSTTATASAEASSRVGPLVPARIIAFPLCLLPVPGVLFSRPLTSGVKVSRLLRAFREHDLEGRHAGLYLLLLWISRQLLRDDVPEALAKRIADQRIYIHLYCKFIAHVGCRLPDVPFFVWGGAEPS